MTAPTGLAELVLREIKEHRRDSSGKGNGGQEAWGRGSKVTSEAEGWTLATDMEKKKDYEAAGGERVGEDQEGRNKVTQSLWTWIRGRIAGAFVM